jgi:hypothetical protein
MVKMTIFLYLLVKCRVIACLALYINIFTEGTCRSSKYFYDFWKLTHGKTLTKKISCQYPLKKGGFRSRKDLVYCITVYRYKGGVEKQRSYLFALKNIKDL